MKCYSTKSKRDKNVNPKVKLQIYTFAEVADSAAARAAFMKQLSSKQLLNGAVDMETESSSAMREMMERHALEIAQLENELRSEEISKINEVIVQIQIIFCFYKKLFFTFLIFKLHRLFPTLNTRRRKKSIG